jgi:hypothetical protein
MLIGHFFVLCTVPGAKQLHECSFVVWLQLRCRQTFSSVMLTGCFFVGVAGIPQNAA